MSMISISIPSGTIKRIHPCATPTSTVCISIPSGTIKRTINFHNVLSFKIFQFLLVRLKEIAVISTVVFFNIISIPSGTIKRFYFDSNKVFSYKFQFLLVRLKAGTRAHGRTGANNFNSFWYD